MSSLTKDERLEMIAKMLKANVGPLFEVAASRDIMARGNRYSVSLELFNTDQVPEEEALSSAMKVVSEAILQSPVDRTMITSLKCDVLNLQQQIKDLEKYKTHFDLQYEMTNGQKRF